MKTRKRQIQILRLLCMAKEPLTFHQIYTRLEQCTGSDFSYVGVYVELRSLCRSAFVLDFSIEGSRDSHYSVTEFGRAAAQTYSPV